MSDTSVSEGGSGPRGLSRRRLLGIAGTAAGGLALGAPGRGLFAPEARAALASGQVAFFGRHQAGITTTPSQGHLWFGSFDVEAGRAGELRDLLRMWTDAAADLTAGRTTGADAAVTRDSGDALGLDPARLTLTFGFGPSLFDRYGLRGRRPAALIDVPPFATDALEAGRTGGELCVQACADDAQVAFHALRMLTELAGGAVRLRWSQRGFQSAPPGATPRNLLGFKDGTNNLDPTDARRMAANVWVGREGPRWMRGGTYMVVRRVRAHLGLWDAEQVSEQERTFGRRKLSGAPIGGKLETDPVDSAKLSHRSHILQANPRKPGSEEERILRRGYSYADGEPAHTLDAGLFFVAFQRDPRRQFVPIQSRLAARDLLNEYVVHTGSAIFAVPPGVERGGFVGERLLA